MKYEVILVESNSGILIVEAGNVEEAVKKAEREYGNEEVFWKKNKIEIVSVTRADREDLQ